MKIEKLGNNQVKVIRQKTIKDTAGKSVIIDDEPVEYGIGKLNYEKEAIQAQIDFWSTPANVQKHITELQAQLDNLNLIDLELKKK